MDFAGLSIERNNPKRIRKRATKENQMVWWCRPLVASEAKEILLAALLIELASHGALPPLSETDQMDGRSFVSLDTTLLPREDDTSFLVLANITGR